MSNALSITLHPRRQRAVRFARTAVFAMCVSFGVCADVIAAGQPQQGSTPTTLLQRRNPGIGGVIDRTTPRSSARPADTNLAEFNRLPQTRLPASTAFAPAATVRDPTNGEVLYTILERTSSVPSTTRPVSYVSPALPVAPHVTSANQKSSSKRYCTVTEVARSTSGGSCR